jgi:hypothetical protein
VEAVELITVVDKACPGGQMVEWQHMFEYVMYEQEPAIVFESFVAWNRSILTNGASKQLIGDERQGPLDQLLSGFVTMCVGSPRLQKEFQAYLIEGMKPAAR